MGEKLQAGLRSEIPVGQRYPSTTADKKPSSHGVDEKILLQMSRSVCATRQFELRCMDLYRQALIRGYPHPFKLMNGKLHNQTAKYEVVHEACKRGGIGGDIAAMIMEEA